MKEHNEYRILCGLAAAGEVASDDMEELNRHLQECDDCRLLLSEFVQVSAQALPLLVDHEPATPRGMKARFIERARAEGVPLRSPESLLSGVSFLFRPQLAWAAIATAGLLIWVTVWHFGSTGRSASHQVSYERSSPDRGSSSSSMGSGQPTASSSESEVVSRLKGDLAKEQTREHALEMQIAQIEDDRAAVPRTRPRSFA